MTDIKNYLYCPRVVFFHYALPERPVTFKMEEGKRAAREEEAREVRRGLGRYGLGEGERIFRMALASERLGLSGVVDLVIRTRWEAVPVEFKDSTAPVALRHKYQLTAYALLCEEALRLPVRRGLVWRIPARSLTEVPITPEARAYTVAVVGEIRRMLAEERMPPPTRRKERCAECEFRRWCWDRG